MVPSVHRLQCRCSWHCRNATHIQVLGNRLANESFHLHFYYEHHFCSVHAADCGSAIKILCIIYYMNSPFISSIFIWLAPLWHSFEHNRNRDYNTDWLPYFFSINLSCSTNLIVSAIAVVVSNINLLHFIFCIGIFLEIINHLFSTKNESISITSLIQFIFLFKQSIWNSFDLFRMSNGIQFWWRREYIDLNLFDRFATCMDCICWYANFVLQKQTWFFYCKLNLLQYKSIKNWCNLTYNIFEQH